jgi:hypothetical protein
MGGTMTEELAKWITQTIFQSVMDNMKDGKAVVSVNGVTVLTFTENGNGWDIHWDE